MTVSQFVQHLFTSTTYLRQPENLYVPIDYTMRLGGKRLRPQLLLTATEMFGGDIQKAAPAALAIEVFHNFTLLHDDLMDRSPLRRGQPTVYHKWNENIAILSGDAMMVIAWGYLLDLPECNPTLLRCYNDTAIGIFEGQQMDMDFEKRDDVTLDEYMKMIRLKTAVLLAGALKIGALCAHAPEADIERLYEAGIHTGLAFQLQDDLLDTYGETATLGKQIGQDIVDNKKTFLPLKAFELATPEQATQLRTLLNDARIDRQEKVARVVEIYDALDIPRHTEARILEEFEHANRAIDAIQIPETRKTELRTLVASLSGRKK